MTGINTRRNNYVWMSLLAFILLSLACRKSIHNEPTPTDPNPIPSPIPETPTDAEATPIGTIIGAAEQKVIGPAGGTFTTADNRITLEFPAGALTTETTITIQPVTNNCPGGAGNVMRITPHNVNFKKPVKLGFSYSDTDYVSSAAAALTIAYQDAERFWRSAPNMVKDTSNKKVWVTTDHFSDWALFKAFELIPYSTIVEPGKQIYLGVVKLTDFKNDSLIPIPDPLRKKKGIVKQWSLSGAGTLVKNAADNDAAVYTAPNAIPAKNPVAVSAVLNIWSNFQFTLVSNIYIGQEGVTFRIDGGPWMHCIDPDGIFFDGYYHSIVAANLSTPQHDGVSLKWAGAQTVHQFKPWGLASTTFQYSPTPETHYIQLLVFSATPSPGGIYFHLGSENLDYAVGTFMLSPAQRIIANTGGIPQYSLHKIEGFFKVKWKK